MASQVRDALRYHDCPCSVRRASTSCRWKQDGARASGVPAEMALWVVSSIVFWPSYSQPFLRLLVRDAHPSKWPCLNFSKAVIVKWALQNESWEVCCARTLRNSEVFNCNRSYHHLRKRRHARLCWCPFPIKVDLDFCSTEAPIWVHNGSNIINHCVGVIISYSIVYNAMAEIVQDAVKMSQKCQETKYGDTVSVGAVLFMGIISRQTSFEGISSSPTRVSSGGMLTLLSA